MADVNINHVESDEEDDAGWEECEDEAVTIATCLFCDGTFSSADETFRHCSEVHQFDIKHIQRVHQLDCFSYIKMINYIRLHKPSVAEVGQTMAHQLWQVDDYMKPQVTDDPLLIYDIEEGLDVGGDIDCPIERQSIMEDSVTLSRSDYANLLRRLEIAERKVNESQDQVNQTLEDLHKIRSAAREVMFSQNVDLTKEKPIENKISDIREDDSNAYFSSYSHYSIHEQMLKDTVRTESYRDFILGNKELFADKVVLDVGCGSGILSMFAAQAGARKVIGIDFSEIIYQAMDIVRENGFEKKITLIKGKVEEVELPVDKVDIIVSEWMGYFLLFESMLDTVLYARDKWLAADGVIVPDLCNISLIALTDQSLYDRSIGFWDDVYGFKMTSIKNEVIKEANVQIVKPDHIATEPAILKDIDIHTCQIKDLEFSSPFTLKATSTGKITALIGYFDIWFSKGLKKVEFSTGPEATPTHWKQTVFLLPNPISVEKGKELDGQLICKKKRGDPRSIVVTISLQGQLYKYIMD